MDLASGPGVSEHFAGGTGGQIEPFPYSNPAPAAPPGGGEAYDPYQQAANRSSWGPNTMASMQMPDARNYAGGGDGWYGNDGYGVAAGMAGAGAAGIGAGAAAARGYDHHHQQQQPTERDYRSETGSQGGESSAYGGYGNPQPQSQPPLTPAALAKQREAAGNRQAYQSHSSRTSHGSGGLGGPSGSGAGYLTPTAEGNGGDHLAPTAESGSPGVEDRRSSAQFSNGGQSVYQHADMPGQDEVTEIPPK